MAMESVPLPLLEVRGDPPKDRFKMFDNRRRIPPFASAVIERMSAVIELLGGHIDYPRWQIPPVVRHHFPGIDQPPQCLPRVHQQVAAVFSG